MQHTMKFNHINDLLEWIVENEFYNHLPVDLTIHLGKPLIDQSSNVIKLPIH